MPPSAFSAAVAVTVGSTVFLMLYTVRAEYRLRARYPQLYAGLGPTRGGGQFVRLLVLTFRPEWRNHPDRQVRIFIWAYRALFVAWMAVFCLPILVVQHLMG